MATRLPYYTGNDDVYSQLMRQFETELPYYSAPVTSGGGYDPTLYYRQLRQDYGAGLLGDGGMYAGAADGGFAAPSESTSMGGGLLGSLGIGSTAPSDGTVSTGLGGLSLSPSGTVTANTISAPVSMGLTGLGLVTGMPLGLIGMISNQSAQNAAQGLTSSLSDTMGLMALSLRLDLLALAAPLPPLAQPLLLLPLLPVCPTQQLALRPRRQLRLLLAG